MKHAWNLIGTFAAGACIFFLWQSWADQKPLDWPLTAWATLMGINAYLPKLLEDYWQEA